ncbi:MAG: M48 family metalloprotease [Proteobacteria bacterium]|nr:M48 family metalloprotease [Pseudomonadota bacterium]MBU1737444.1 M48 family metalloprotease [Pseudomonadota bacterium]
MNNKFGNRIFTRSMSRRDFLYLLSLSSAAYALTGCAVDPVTGRQQLVLMSEEGEISLDRQQSPQQFSMDYGVCQDRALNDYVGRVGSVIAATSHRPGMPYSFRAVNAVYVNAYAFPGGSIAVTRGILAELQDEAALAALLGHEIGHVNARHTAERMTKGTLVQLALAGSSGYMRSGEYAGYAPYLDKIGGLGAQVLLASYSRVDEREADSLGMEYMVRGGHNPKGMSGLMEVLVKKSQHKPNALELMFSTHPMSQERYDTAVRSVESQYASYRGRDMLRQRYMDNTAGIRKIRGALEDMQNGAGFMAAGEMNRAESSFADALKKAPDDYAALLMMAKCKMALKKDQEAVSFAEQAKRVYPTEAQAVQVSGVGKLALNRFSEAYQEFSGYDRMMPGNPSIAFLKGVSLEGMQKRQEAAEEYYRYLQQVREGGAAQHAYQRLQDWGVVK